MKLTTKLLSLSMVICSSMIPLTAQAGNNQMQQMMIMNNLSAQEQTISGQISTYVNSGQLSPQQGAAFSSELSQISSQAMMAATNPVQTSVVVNELNSLSAQINGSLQIPGQYAVVPAYGATTVYGATPVPGFYNNWRAHLAQQENYAYNKQLQTDRLLQSEQNQINKANYNNAVKQERVNNTIQNERLQQSAAAQRYNTELNNLKTNEARAAYQRTHPAPPTH